jgi:two-component system, cell cycle sensor histidine kinase and response regulator CckA
MNYEKKTEEQLVENSESLRRESIDLKMDSNGQAICDELPEPLGFPVEILQDETPEFQWSTEDAYTAIWEDASEYQEGPSFLSRDMGKNKVPAGVEVSPKDVTETGSFDLRWIANASFGKLLQAIPMPVVLTDIYGAVQFANNVFLSMLMDASAILGGSLFTLFPSLDEVDRGKAVLEKVFGERKSQLYEGSLNVHGSEMWGRFHFRPVRLGAQRSALVLIEDLTLERRELSLNEKYKKLVRIFPMGIAEFTLSKPLLPDLPEAERIALLLGAELTDGNDEFARLNGRESLTELRGLSLRKVLPSGEKDLEFYRTWVHSPFAPGQWETKEVSFGGDLKYFENTLVGNVRDGSVRQFWVMKMDITDRKTAQEALISKLKTIDELYEHIVQSGKAKAIAEHTATVAHELRQPLAIIGGFARRIALKTPAASGSELESQKDWSNIIIREVERLEKILGKLIDFGRHESIRLQCANPNDLIQYVIHVHEGRLREKNLRLELNLAEEIVEVPVDPDRFQQVIRNLLANAIEASPQDGTIYIETGVTIPSEKAHQTGELESAMYFEMKVKNLGSVIPPDELGKVFDPFFTKKTYGTGLGLTLTKKVIAEHKGSISVKSSDKDGTTFTVWLPVERLCTEK